MRNHQGLASHPASAVADFLTTPSPAAQRKDVEKQCEVFNVADKVN
jgi:hypothetical protein